MSVMADVRRCFDCEFADWKRAQWDREGWPWRRW